MKLKLRKVFFLVHIHHISVAFSPSINITALCSHNGLLLQVPPHWESNWGHWGTSTFIIFMRISFDITAGLTLSAGFIVG